MTSSLFRVSCALEVGECVALLGLMPQKQPSPHLTFQLHWTGTFGHATLHGMYGSSLITEGAVLVLVSLSSVPVAAQPGSGMEFGLETVGLPRDFARVEALRDRALAPGIYLVGNFRLVMGLGVCKDPIRARVRLVGSTGVGCGPRVSFCSDLDLDFAA